MGGRRYHRESSSSNWRVFPEKLIMKGTAGFGMTIGLVGDEQDSAECRGRLNLLTWCAERPVMVDAISAGRHL